MAHKVIVPQKKVMSRSFLNSGTLIVKIISPEGEDHKISKGATANIRSFKQFIQQTLTNII
jgi:hypothetical protein